MTRSLAFRLGILLVAATLMAQSGAENRPSTGSTQDRFVGAWRLAWLEQADANGKVHKEDCTGLLVYTRDGHMSVQVQYRTSKADDKAALVQYAQGGYEASFGTYKIEDAHTFTFHVEGALVRTLIGKDLKRVYEFSGNQLIVKSPDPKEHWKVAWERVIGANDRFTSCSHEDAAKAR